MLKQFIEYYTPHKKLLILDLVTAAFRALFAIIIPYLVKIILDKREISLPVSTILYLLFGIVLLIFLMSVASYINIRWGHILGTRMETDMRNNLFRHLQKLSFSYFDNTKTGHIMSRISNDLFTISEVAHHAPEDLFISLFMISGAFCFMFSFNPLLAFIAFLPIPLMVAWGIIFKGRMKRGFRQVRKKIADINSNVENSIQGIREVKSFAKESYAIERFCEVNDEFRFAKESMYKVMAGFHAGMMFLTESYSLVVIGAGALLAHYDKVQMSEIIAFLLYVRFILNPVNRLVNFVEQYQQGATSFERFLEIMNVVPDIKDSPNPNTPTSLQGEITTKNLYFKYNQDNDWILKNINIKISSGQTIALVGESGAGKSTLATLIPRFYEPQQGSICIDSYDISTLKQRFLRQHIGLVQQNVFLFDSTIRENIIFGNPTASEKQLIQAAKNANIYQFIQTLPNGFNTLVGEHGVKLSGGQKQRISIARVFLKNPEILIFDEATSSLDTESEELIRQSMETLCHGRTTIIIAHRLSTVKNADYTYVLKHGEIIEQGTHQQLLKRNGYYTELYNNSIF